MRGRPLREEGADGLLRTYAYQYHDPTGDGTNDVLEIASRTGTAALPDGLPNVSAYTIEQLDALFGRLLRRETRLYTGGAAPLLDWETRAYDEKGRLVQSDFSDGTSAHNGWGCCRLEWTQARDGSLRDYFAIPGDDRWSAVAESSLASLPGANGRHPVAESFADALGRGTNAVRAVWHSSGRDPAYAPLQTRTAYPHGTDHHRVVTDPLGVETVSRNRIVQTGGLNRLVDETVSAGVTNRTTLIPGGAAARTR